MEDKESYPAVNSPGKMCLYVQKKQNLIREHLNPLMLKAACLIITLKIHSIIKINIDIMKKLA